MRPSFVAPCLLLFMVNYSFAQTEIVKHIATFRTANLLFALREHGFPAQDSATYQLQITAYNLSPREEDQLYYKAPHPDAYLTAAQLERMFAFIEQYNGRTVNFPGITYWEDISEGFRVGVHLGTDPDKKRILFKLWGVQRVVTPDDWMKPLPYAKNFLKNAQRVAEKYAASTPVDED